MTNQLEPIGDELTNDVNPSNNQKYGTESNVTDSHSEDWDPLQDENDVSEEDDDTSVAEDNNITEAEDDDIPETEGDDYELLSDDEEPLEDEDDPLDLDTDESTGNSGL